MFDLSDILPDRLLAEQEEKFQTKLHIFVKNDKSRCRMYGRANFDLLKRRVLHHRKKRQPRKNKRSQRPQEGRLKKPSRMENGTTFQHTTFSISKGA